MRSVFVFPLRDRTDVVGMLDRMSPGQNDPWFVDGGLYVDIETPESEDLYVDWAPESIESLVNAVGERPGWAVGIDVSGRIDGTDEVRRLALRLLDRGGVAFDDYSDHPWTATEIESNARFHGLSFFDFRGYYESEATTR